MGLTENSRRRLVTITVLAISTALIPSCGDEPIAPSGVEDVAPESMSVDTPSPSASEYSCGDYRGLCCFRGQDAKDLGIWGTGVNKPPADEMSFTQAFPEEWASGERYERYANWGLCLNGLVCKHWPSSYVTVAFCLFPEDEVPYQNGQP